MKSVFELRLADGFSTRNGEETIWKEDKENYIYKIIEEASENLFSVQIEMDICGTSS